MLPPFAGWLAAALGAYAAALTLAPQRGSTTPGWPWPVALGWPLLAGWLGRHLHRRGYNLAGDLWPPAAALTGLGLLTLYRLNPLLGLRQTLWVVLGLAAFWLLLAPGDLWAALRRLHLWGLGLGVALTGLTFLAGVSPSGSGPRLWLRLGAVYFQPAEALKLLFLLFLAAHLARRLPALNDPARPWRARIALLLPSALAAGVSMGLPFAQRDWGTALVILGLYGGLLYAATGWRGLPALALAGGLLAGVAGYAATPLMRQRIAAWLHPWADPQGYGYQPIQAALAMARGGIFGRGPGWGTPYHVPLAHSDFIFVAIVEELGLLGGLAVLILLLTLSLGALRVAARRQDAFGRLLAAGLGLGYGGQSLLILGGNLRLWPLTGLPLPFVAYGGSALLVAFAGLALLVRLDEGDASAAASPARQLWCRAWPCPLRRLAQALAIGFLLVAVALTLR